MSANSNIEWTDHTFNPWIGCTAISPGCANCYASDWAKRYGRDFAQRTRTKTWADPVKWNKQHDEFFAQHGRRQRVFCASLADVFDNQVPEQWRADLFSLIEATPNIDWLLLTKRIGNVGNMLPVPFDFEKLYPNVWIGITITSQEEADRDIPKLLAVPAAKRFLSMEPLLGPVSFEGFFANPRNAADGTNALEALDWVIVGGESGPGAQPMHPDWARSLRDQCEAVGTPFLFKQWGEWVPYEHSAQPPYMWSQHGKEIDGHCLPDPECSDYIPSLSEWHLDWMDNIVARRVGKRAAGRMLDGVEHNGFPA